MAFTITLTGPVENINATDTYKMILTFSNSGAGANQSFTFADKNVMTIDHGKTKWSLDFNRSGLVVPQSMRFKLSDKDGYIRGLLMGTTAEQLATAKQFKVEIQLNGTADFIGNAIEDDIKAKKLDNGTAYEVSFTAAPQMESVMKEMLYDDADVALNPFAYTSTVQELVTDQILNIYKLMNSTITLFTSQNWRWQDTLATIDIPFTDLKMSVKSTHFDNLRGARTAGDALKLLAQDFGCYTGLLNFDKAFFFKLFRYDATNTQTLDTVLSLEEGFHFNLIYWVEVTPGLGAVKEAGTFTKIQNQFMKLDNVWDAGMTDTASSKQITKAKDPDWMSVFDDHSKVLADFWFRFRGDITKLRADSFKVMGVDYTFTKVFTHNSFKYQIVELEKDWEMGTSFIRALNLGT